MSFSCTYRLPIMQKSFLEFTLPSFKWDTRFIIVVFVFFHWGQSYNSRVKRLIMCVYVPINISNFTFLLWFVTIRHINLGYRSREVKFSIGECKENPRLEHMWLNILKTNKFLILSKLYLYFHWVYILTCMLQIRARRYQSRFHRWIYKWWMNSWM